jgi:energy-coupling factor transporter ATP-binding protein EcfA2
MTLKRIMGLLKLFRKKKEIQPIQPFELIKKKKDGDFMDFYEKLIKYSLIILITGKRGSGKTSLGMIFLEIYHSLNKKCYAVGFDKAKIPRWLKKVKAIEEAPNNSTVLIDEGAILYSSRDSMKNSNKMLGKLMAIARHKNLNLILITQSTAMLDVNVLRLVDILLLKEPSLLQSEFERKALQKIYKKINPFFKKIPKSEIKEKYFYVWSDDFQGMLKYNLPNFWNDSISKSFQNFK